jgi:hypothetical protein
MVFDRRQTRRFRRLAFNCYQVAPSQGDRGPRLRPAAYLAATFTSGCSIAVAFGLPSFVVRGAVLGSGEREHDHHPQRLARRGEYSRIYHDVTHELITSEM